MSSVTTKLSLSEVQLELTGFMKQPEILGLMQRTRAQFKPTVTSSAVIHSLSSSPQRQWMWLKHLSNPDHEKQGLAYFNILERLPGVAKLAEFRHANDFTGTMCDDYIFRNEAWYREAMRSPERKQAMKTGLFRAGYHEFLTEKGYRLTDRPGPEDIVVYFTYVYALPGEPPQQRQAPRPAHYGKVERIDGDKIVVRSKFGHSYAYTHELELIPYFFGSHYAIYTRTT